MVLAVAHRRRRGRGPGVEYSFVTRGGDGSGTCSVRLLAAGGVIALFYRTRNFFAIASILGYIFVIIGIMWIVEAFLARDYADLW
jgi:hypothetical protein